MSSAGGSRRGPDRGPRRRSDGGPATSVITRPQRLVPECLRAGGRPSGRTWGSRRIARCRGLSKDRSKASSSRCRFSAAYITSTFAWQRNPDRKPADGDVARAHPSAPSAVGRRFTATTALSEAKLCRSSTSANSTFAGSESVSRSRMNKWEGQPACQTPTSQGMTTMSQRTPLQCLARLNTTD